MKTRDSGETEEKLIKKYTPLVHKIARQYASEDSAIDTDDLLQEGFLGLLMAIRKHEPDRGACLYSLAERYIRSQISNYAMTNGVAGVRVSFHHGRQTRYVWKATDLMDAQGLGDIAEDVLAVWEHPSEEMLSDDAQKRMRQLKSQIDTTSSKSYEATMRDIDLVRQSAPIEAAMSMPAESVDLDSRIALRDALGHLTARERGVVLMHSDGFTYEEIAELHGVTKQRVGQIISDAHRRLRKLLGGQR